MVFNYYFTKSFFGGPVIGLQRFLSFRSLHCNGALLFNVLVVAAIYFLKKFMPGFSDELQVNHARFL